LQQRGLDKGKVTKDSEARQKKKTVKGGTTERLDTIEKTPTASVRSSGEGTGKTGEPF